MIRDVPSSPHHRSPHPTALLERLPHRVAAVPPGPFGLSFADLAVVWSITVRFLMNDSRTGGRPGVAAVINEPESARFQESSLLATPVRRSPRHHPLNQINDCQSLITTLASKYPMKQLTCIAFLATAIILPHPLTILEAQQQTPPTANTTNADETDLSIARSDPSTLRFRIEQGSNCLLRINGTSSTHDWQVESKMIEGYIDLGADSLAAVPKAPMEGMPVKAELRIPVLSLKSVDATGKPIGAAMDDVMYLLLRETNNHQINYTLTELVPKEGLDGFVPRKLDAKGTLAVAGVKREVTTRAEVTVGGGKLRFRTETKLKMTDFNIDPPVLKTVNGTVKLSYDEVTVSIEGTATTATTP